MKFGYYNYKLFEVNNLTSIYKFYNPIEDCINKSQETRIVIYACTDQR